MKTLENKKHSGFTLVELIVVIVILAILATIAFLSFSSQSSSARDSSRMADVSNISKGLGVFNATSGTYPMPDSPTTIVAGSGTMYQGTAAKNILGMLKMSDAKDNLDSNYYSYSLDQAKAHFTIGGFLENPPTSMMNTINPFEKMNATDYTNRYIFFKGDSVGILTASGTNTPIEQIDAYKNISVNIATIPTALNLNISKTSVISGTGQILGAIQSLANGNYNFNAPANCPTGFIPVPGNLEFSQPGFCVAKYEMTPVSTVGLTQNATYKTWNFSGGIAIASAPNSEPIATITQPQAIAACRLMGAGYHLITNNEWMAVARNIEANSTNWSGNAVGSGYIYSGHNDNVPATAVVASTDGSTGYINTGNSSGNQKRTLTLSNGQVIWDLAGNVWEHVNKANTLDATNIDSNGFSVESACSNGTWNWWSWTGNDGVAECGYQNSYSRSLYGPKGDYNANQGMGRIYATNVEDRANVFIRGGGWDAGAHAGVFALVLNWSASLTNDGVGFRCAK